MLFQKNTFIQLNARQIKLSLEAAILQIANVNLDEPAYIGQPNKSNKGNYVQKAQDVQNNSQTNVI